MRSGGSPGVKLGLALAAVTLMSALGCATARNYDDPAGPIQTGRQPAPPRTTSEVRLVTFNIKFGEHVDRAAALLSRPGPLRDADVLLLQEMDGPGTEALARALGMNYVYVPSAVHPSSDRDFGVAVLSPWPLEDARKVLLPHPHRFRKLQRAAAGVTVLTPVGRLRVYSIHFETPFGAWRGENRRDQARAVLADAKDWTEAIVIGGDFNGGAGVDEIGKAGFLWLTRHVTGSGLLSGVDHLLVRGLCAAGASTAGRARDDIGASDHSPVWAVARPCDPTQAVPLSRP